MLSHLKLERFKNFKTASLDLGPLTLLIGSNAAGKSNIRDAFRFLHGVSRGYNLAEIMGEKYIEGGVLQWRGIRGGIREATYLQADTFVMTVDLSIKTDLSSRDVRYSIEVEPGAGGGGSRVVKESLYVDDDMKFDFHPSDEGDRQHIVVRIPAHAFGGGRGGWHIETFIAHQPVLTQIAERIEERIEHRRMLKEVREVVSTVKKTIAALGSMRFLDLNPEAMRMPSLPGQIVLGDRGENLSSVLQAIYHNPQQRIALIEWIRELTPMDATDFEFIPDQTGKILLSLVEENGRRTSAYSASDGTLRFLAMIAALLGPEPARFYFFEELDNGLHPARLHLLLQLVEQKTSEKTIQMVATTHSPQLMRFLSPGAREHASLVYRPPEQSEGRIRGILDIPNIREILEEQDLARLHESGWFEDAMVYLEAEESE